MQNLLFVFIQKSLLQDIRWGKWLYGAKMNSKCINYLSTLYLLLNMADLSMFDVDERKSIIQDMFKYIDNFINKPIDKNTIRSIHTMKGYMYMLDKTEIAETCQEYINTHSSEVLKSIRLKYEQLKQLYEFR